MTYAEIVEIQELRNPREVNAFLAAGYQLLDFHPIAFSADHPGGRNNPPQYVRRAIRYVVGRTSAVEAFSLAAPRFVAANEEAAS